MKLLSKKVRHLTVSWTQHIHFKKFQDTHNSFHPRKKKKYYFNTMASAIFTYLKVSNVSTKKIDLYHPVSTFFSSNIKLMKSWWKCCQCSPRFHPEKRTKHMENPSKTAEKPPRRWQRLGSLPFVAAQRRRLGRAHGLCGEPRNGNRTKGNAKSWPQPMDKPWKTHGKTEKF